jgi:PKD repeat protein
LESKDKALNLPKDNFTIMSLKIYNKLIINVSAVGILTFSGLVSTPIVAQSPDGQNHNICGNETDKMALEIPGFWEGYQQFVNQFNAYKDANLNGVNRSETNKRIIPVVVHVLHAGGPENISRAQIIDQLSKGNLDFSFSNTDKLNIPAQFDSIAGNPNIEFRLATKDPLGNCTDGINRVYTPKTEEARDQTDFKRISVWDRSKYLNIWVVSTISNFTPFGTVLGYAQFPYTFNNQVPSTSTDGIVLIHNRTGTTGTAAGTVGRTFTHEVGHWLGLRHIWGDADCGDDGVEDTPFHKQENFGCYNFPKEATCYSLTENSTAQDTIQRFIIGEMFNNYMDYTNDNCMNMFSKGQVDVIDFVLNDISFRRTLWQNENTIQTGTRDEDLTSPCAPPPIADLWSRTGSNLYFTKKLICAGNSLAFRDGSYGSATTQQTERTWTLSGASSQNPIGATPSVTYPTPGIYDAAISVSNTNGTSSKVRSNYVQVSSTTADDSNWMYFDSFEYNSMWDKGKWVIINEGKDGNGWNIAPSNASGYKSGKVMRMKNTEGLPRERFYLISPSYDLTTVNSPELTLHYAYGPRSNQPFIVERQQDQVRFYVSTNCGESWSLRPFTRSGTSSMKTVLEGADLNTAGLYANGFAPNSDDQFRSITIDLASQTNASNLRFMVEFTSGGPWGNDFFVDHLTIRNKTTNIDNNQVENDVKLFPNPANEFTNLLFNMPEAGNMQIQLFDITGRLVLAKNLTQLEQGQHQVSFNKSEIGSSGVYIFKLNIAGQFVTKRLIIE